MMLELLSGLGIVLASALLIVSFLFLNNLRKDRSYSFAMIFLKPQSIMALSLLIACFILFSIARIVSFLIVLYGLREELELSIISYVRAPIDFIAAIFLLSSIIMLYRVTRRPTSSQPS